MPVALLIVLTGSAISSSAADKVTYVDHILPIFRNTCLNCHNPDKKKAGLDLTTYQATMMGSENGPVIKPGQADGSLLFKVSAHTEEPKMPPKGDKMTEAELGLLKNWIAGFALETSSSKPAAAAQNQVTLAAVSLTKPDGPPPMPTSDLPLEPVVRPKGRNSVTALAASPWAPLVAVGGQKQIVLYQTETLQPLGVLPFPEGFPQIIRFSRNGQLLLTGGGLGGKSGKVVLWNVLTGERAGSVGDEVDQVLAADMSPDQAYVALGGPTKVLKIYQTKDGKLLHTLKKHTEWVTAVAFSPDGKYLASADRNGGVMVWEGATGKEYQALTGHKTAVTALSFMPGLLASASTDGKITLWEMKEGKDVKSWTAHAGGVEWVDFTPDGRLVSCGRDKIAKVWDQTGKVLFTCGEPFGDIALRAVLNSERLIATDWTGRIRAFAADGKPLAELTANPPPIAEQLASAQKRVADAEVAVPAAEKSLAEAEARLGEEKAAANERVRKAQIETEQLKAIEPDLEKQLSEARVSRQHLAEARGTAQAEKQAAAKALQEKEQAGSGEILSAKDALAAKTTAATEVTKKLQDCEVEIKAIESRLSAAKAETPGKLAAVEKTAKEAATFLTALSTVAAPTSGPTTKLVTNDEKVAAAQKKLDDAASELAKRREIRAKQAEGSAEYEKANAAVQAGKADVALAETELAAAQNTAPTVVQIAAGSKQHPLVEAVATARAAREQAKTQITVARADVERWQRAQAFMTVHRAELGYSDMKAKYEELIATAKDALRPAEMAEQQIAALEKAAIEGPTKLKEAEAEFVRAQGSRDTTAKAIAEAEAALAGKRKTADQSKAAEAEIATATKKVMELNAEIERRRLARAALQDGTPEYAKANEAVQSQKPLIAAAEQAVADLKAKLTAAAGSAEAGAAIALAEEALKNAQAAAKRAAEKVSASEKAMGELKKSLQEGATQLVELKQKAPILAEEGRQAKAKAEQEAAAIAQQLDRAKADAQQLRAEFNTKWNKAPRAASNGKSEPLAGKS